MRAPNSRFRQPSTNSRTTQRNAGTILIAWSGLMTLMARNTLGQSLPMNGNPIVIIGPTVPSLMKVINGMAKSKPRQSWREIVEILHTQPY